MMWNLIVTALFPPSDADPKQVLRWRRSIAILVLAFGGLTVTNTWVMWGIWPVSLVFAGFASAADLGKIDKGQQAIQQSLNDAKQQEFNGRNDIKSTIIGQNIYNLRIMQCNQLRAKNGAAVESLEKQIQEKRMEYFAVAGAPYETSSCENLGLAP